MLNFIYNLNTYYVFLISILSTFLCTVSGSLIIYFLKKENKLFMNILLGLSSGIMLSSAIFSLLIPSIEESELNNLNTLIVITSGLLLGSLFILIANILTTKKNNKNTLILIISIIMHNIPEGASIGIAFGNVLTGHPIEAAISLAIGIGIQNIPEGAAISIPCYNSGISKNKSFIIGILSGIVEPIAAVLSFILVTKITYLLPYSLSFAAGAMLYVIIYEMIPESQENGYKNIVSITTILGFLLMVILELFI